MLCASLHQVCRLVGTDRYRLKKKNISAEFFQVHGPLPPEGVIQRSLPPGPVVRPVALLLPLGHCLAALCDDLLREFGVDGPGQARFLLGESSHTVTHVSYVSRDTQVTLRSSRTTWTPPGA